MKHLPAAEWNSAQVEKLAAWFAAQRGDDEAERSALERLIAADPTDFAALDRLIELLVKNGQPDRRRRFTAAGKTRSHNCKLATGSSSPGTSRGATPRAWAAWPSNSAAGLRPRPF